MFYAHISDDKRKQTVREHLDNVAELAENNAADAIKPLAHAAGKAHDIGKYSKSFQQGLTAAL